MTDREEAEIVRKVKKNPRLSARDLKTEPREDRSTQSVRRTIKKHGYNNRVARKKTLLAERIQKLRENFAKEYAKKDQSWCDDVIFLDESKLNLFGSDGKTTVKPNSKTRRRRCYDLALHFHKRSGKSGVYRWYNEPGPEP